MRHCVAAAVVVAVVFASSADSAGMQGTRLLVTRLQWRHGISTGLTSSVSSSRKATQTQSRKATLTRAGKHHRLAQRNRYTGPSGLETAHTGKRQTIGQLRVSGCEGGDICKACALGQRGAGRHRGHMCNRLLQHINLCGEARAPTGGWSSSGPILPNAGGCRHEATEGHHSRRRHRHTLACTVHTLSL